MRILVEVRQVTKKFGAKEVLKGISFDIHEAEIVSLLGINGAGKTTLSSIIATLHPATSGDVFFQGTSIYEDVASYRCQIGYCPQKPNLNAALTVYQNLDFAGRYFGMEKQEIAERIEELSGYFGLKQYLHAKPNTLSGGYKQRVSLARSLMHNPKLVILDEPTVSLDPHVRHQLWNYIKKLKEQGVSVLLTTHYLDEAEILSDRVCVLDQGMMRLIDTPANLMQSFQKNKLEDVFLHLMEANKNEGAL